MAKREVVRWVVFNPKKDTVYGHRLKTVAWIRAVTGEMQRLDKLPELGWLCTRIVLGDEDET